MQLRAQAVLSMVKALPSDEMVSQQLLSLPEIQQRGTLTPDENEKLYELFSQYLRVRAGLWDMLRDLLAEDATASAPAEADTHGRYAIGMLAACALYRSAQYLVERFGGIPIIRTCFDRGEPRYGIPRKQFAQIYKSVVRADHYLQFRAGRHYLRTHAAAFAALRDSETHIGAVLDQLDCELETLDMRPRRYVFRRLAYRLYAWRRRRTSALEQMLFTAFRLSGSIVAELAAPHTRKVTPATIASVRHLLEPGDIFITRHQYALSNLFLPGFWPHAALYIGTEAQRQGLGLKADSGNADPHCVLEAKKDGVLYRVLEETLAVDMFVVVRPKLGKEEQARLLKRGMSHANKMYDFEFDFTRSDCLVCTEVIYRAMDGIGGIQFELTERNLRLCLSAEDILEMAVGEGPFDIVALYGFHGEDLYTDPQELSDVVRNSLRQPSGKSLR